MIHLDKFPVRSTFLLFIVAAAIPVAAQSNHDPDRSHYLAPKAKQAPAVDGVADEAAWEKAHWRGIK